MLDMTPGKTLREGVPVPQENTSIPIFSQPIGSLAGMRFPIRRKREAGARSLPKRFEQLRLKYKNVLRHLRLAEELQRCLLPRTLPSLDGVSFAAALRPTQHMAGDFYNVFRLDRDHVGFYAGDAMGHGPAAALLSVYAMLTIQTKRIRQNSYEIIEPGDALARLNDDILTVEFPGMPFLTMTYGVLNVPRRSWVYSCGGHPHPLIVRKDGSGTLLEPTAPLIGVMEAAPFEQRTVTLEPGDRLVLYSDGAQIATWGEHGSGISGLTSLIGTRDGRPLQQVLDESIVSLSFGHHQPDDVSLLAVQVAENPGPA